MPQKYHPCAEPGCVKMISHYATFCTPHVKKTAEWNAKVASKLRGQKRTPEHISRMKAAKSGYRPRLVFGIDPSALPPLPVRTCDKCGTKFTLLKRGRKDRFCSRACGYLNRRGAGAFNWVGFIERACANCGGLFKPKSRKPVRIFCSIRCKAITQKKKQNNKATDIERLIEDAIIRRGISYRDQIPLCGIAIVDFYLPSLNAVVFCDGEYWHSLPGKKDRDRRQTKLLKSKGYHVFRFPGKKIHASADACLDVIAEYFSLGNSGR